MSKSSMIFRFCFALAIAALGDSTFAEKKYGPGVTDTEIKLGQTMPYSGPLSVYGNIGRAQTAYFAKVNAEGGVNGRKLTLLSLDDGYNPAKTMEQTRRLVEQDEVLLLFSNFGTPTNSAIHKYVNAKGVPHLFLVASASKWGDPVNYPWTLPWTPNFRTEAYAYASYVKQYKPNARIGVLYQNDDSGKDFLQHFSDALGPQADKMIVARASYEPTDPTVDTQIVALKGSGADTFMNFAFGKIAAQAIRKAYDVGWKPLQILTLASSPVETVLKPAGLEKASSIVSAAFAKDPGDPQWRDDPALRDYLIWLRQYLPEANPADVLNVAGYSLAQTLVHVLKQCGDNLTRENVMRHATSLKALELPMLLPNIKIHTSADDYFPIEDVQLMRFDGTKWARFGDAIGEPVAASRERER